MKPITTKVRCLKCNVFMNPEITALKTNDINRSKETIYACKICKARVKLCEGRATW